jgi:hypothetical protein
MKPRMPNSPPAVPTMARSRDQGAIEAFHNRGIGDHAPTRLPGGLVDGEHAAVSAIEITLSFHKATPRLLTPQRRHRRPRHDRCRGPSST